MKRKVRCVYNKEEKMLCSRSCSIVVSLERLVLSCFLIRLLGYYLSACKRNNVNFKYEDFKVFEPICMVVSDSYSVVS